MESEGKRLKMLLKALKVNQVQFGRTTQINQSQISNICSGNNRISNMVMNKIKISFPEVNANWLLTGQGDMFLSLGVVRDPEQDYMAGVSPEMPDDDFLRETFAANVRTLALVWGVSQVEFFRRLGATIGRTVASTIFQGETIPKPSVLLSLESVTGIPLGVLFTQQLPPEAFPHVPLNEPIGGVKLSLPIRNELIKLRKSIDALLKADN